MSTTPSAWMTVGDILSEIGITRDTWSKWRARRVGPAMRRLPNGTLRCRRATFDAWFDGLDEQAA